MLARAAAAFVGLRAWQLFGFARLDDHARERFGRSGRWLRDLATLGEGLSRSAQLSAALTGSDGRRPLGRVAATLIARALAGTTSRHSDRAGDPDVEEWIDAARRLSVRELRAVLRDARAGSDIGRPPASASGESALQDLPGGSGSGFAGSGDASDSTSHCPEAGDDPDSDRVLVRLPVPLAILAAFDEALDLHRAVEGRSATITDFVEALVGEAHASGLAVETAGLVADLVSGASDAQIEAALRRATSAWAALPPPAAAPPPTTTPTSSLLRFRELEATAGHGDAVELDRQIRALVAIENDLEARLGEVLAALAERRDWTRLQFAGVGHYAEERLGMSRSRAGERARLARALRKLPAVAAACASGRIAMEAAALIHRLLEGTRAGDGDARLEAAWVAHASTVTIKRLRDEARAAGRYRVRPHPAPKSPPSPLSDAEWHRSIRRAAGTATRRIDAFGRVAAGLEPGSEPDVFHVGAAGDAGDAAPEPDVFRSRLAEPDVFLRLRLPADLAVGFLASLAAARERVETFAATAPWDADWPPASDPAQLSARPTADLSARTIRASEWAARIAFVRARQVPAWVGLLALLEDFATTWDTDEAAPDRRDDRIFVRDGWRCAAPGCTSRCHLEDHHIVYRSRGGSGAEWNRVALCRFHHQRGEHGGLMQVRGTAPIDLTWRLGRADIAVVYRNERRDRNEHLGRDERRDRSEHRSDRVAPAASA